MIVRLLAALVVLAAALDLAGLVHLGQRDFEDLFLASVALVAWAFARRRGPWGRPGTPPWKHGPGAWGKRRPDGDAT